MCKSARCNYYSLIFLSINKSVFQSALNLLSQILDGCQGCFSWNCVSLHISGNLCISVCLLNHLISFRWNSVSYGQRNLHGNQQIKCAGMGLIFFRCCLQILRWFFGNLVPVCILCTWYMVFQTSGGAQANAAAAEEAKKILQQATPMSEFVAHCLFPWWFRTRSSSSFRNDLPIVPAGSGGTVRPNQPGQQNIMQGSQAPLMSKPMGGQQPFPGQPNVQRGPMNQVSDIVFSGQRWWECWKRSLSCSVSTQERDEWGGFLVPLLSPQITTCFVASQMDWNYLLVWLVLCRWECPQWEIRWLRLLDWWRSTNSPWRHSQCSSAPTPWRHSPAWCRAPTQRLDKVCLTASNTHVIRFVWLWRRNGSKADCGCKPGRPCGVM